MEDGYSYNLSFEELHNQGFIVDENIKNPKTGENLDGCVVVKYNSSNKGYDVNYDATCTITGEIKNPSINLTVNTGILNSQGIATSDFDVNVIGTNITSYTYCVGTTECEPTTKVNNSIGTITINNEGINYVCVIGSSEDKNTNKLCKSYKLEKTAVVLGQLVIDGTKGLNGWYVSDVNLSVVDSEGMTSTLNINKITEDTIGTDVILTTTSSSGKTDSKTYTIKVDKTAPTAGTLNINGTKGENDWYTSNVTLTVNNGTDTTSGHNNTTSSISSITSDTTGTNVIVTTTDKAGNTSTRTYNIKVDKTAPIAGTLAINGTKGLGDWYLSDVTLTVNNGSDSTSGHASTTSSHTSVIGNTNGTIVTVTTKDNAGNTSTRNYTIKVNKDKPTEGTLVINGTKGLNDWYVSDVSLSVTDVEGVSSTLNITSITEDTAGTDVIVTSTNTETGAVTTKTHTIKVDKTAPTCTLTVTTSDVSFKTKSSDVTSSGISTSTTENYSSQTMSLSANTFYGYLKDEAGNTGQCSATVQNTTPSYTKTTTACNENSTVSGYTYTCTKEYDTCASGWSSCSWCTYSKCKKVVATVSKAYTKTTKQCQKNESGSTVTYSFGATSISTVSSCTTNTFTCSASTYGQVYIKCDSTYLCSSGTYPNDGGNYCYTYTSGSSYNGCSSGTDTGTNCALYNQTSCDSDWTTTTNTSYTYTYSPSSSTSSGVTSCSASIGYSSCSGSYSSSQSSMKDKKNISCSIDSYNCASGYTKLTDNYCYKIN